MYRKNKMQKGSLKLNQQYIGETIEEKVRRITVNKEPIKDNAPRVYTERKEGILPAHDIRTDKWDAAIDAMDKVSQVKLAGREQRIGEKTFDTMTPDQQKAFVEKFPNANIPKGKSAQGTGGTQGTE